MTSNNFFIYDGCYKKPPTSIISDISFQRILRDDFYKSSVSTVKDCENQSLRNNSDFFLINDINTTLNSTNTNCYIPKVPNANASLFSSNSGLNRSVEIFNSLFRGTTKETGSLDICNNLMYNQNLTNKKCFQYLVDNQVYTPNNQYAYYKKPILNANTIRIMESIDEPDFYKRKITRLQLKSYEDLLKIDNVNFQNSGSLVNSFKEFICNPTSSNENVLDAELIKLKVVYSNLYTSLNSIANDLSSISYLNSFDDETIKAVNLNILAKSRELNSLLTSGGANNGRLDDTTLLTQFKIVENSILLLLIVSAVFYFTKNKTIIKQI